MITRQATIQRIGKTYEVWADLITPNEWNGQFLGYSDSLIDAQVIALSNNYSPENIVVEF